MRKKLKRDPIRRNMCASEKKQRSFLILRNGKKKFQQKN
jgi:hypothetical protein